MGAVDRFMPDSSVSTSNVLNDNNEKKRELKEESSRHRWKAPIPGRMLVAVPGRRQRGGVSFITLDESLRVNMEGGPQRHSLALVLEGRFGGPGPVGCWSSWAGTVEHLMNTCEQTQLDFLLSPAPFLQVPAGCRTSGPSFDHTQPFKNVSHWTTFPAGDTFLV